VGLSTSVAEGAPAALVERALGPSGRSRAEYLILRAVAAAGPFASLAELADHLVARSELGLDWRATRRVADRLRVEGMLGAAPVQLTRYGVDVLTGLTATVERALTPPG
jgi:hypothetical protein